MDEDKTKTEAGLDDELPAEFAEDTKDEPKPDDDGDDSDTEPKEA